MTVSDPSKIKYDSPDALECEEMCYRLAKKIKHDKYKFDIIIGIGRGGWVPARYIADYLGNIIALSHMKIEHYTGIAKTKKVKITEGVSTNVKGKKILLVDDVPDTGDSIEEAVKHLKNKGAKEVRTACLHYKPWSIFKPEYYIKLTRNWVIYPWMRKESIDELKSKGVDPKKTGIPVKEIRKLEKI